MTTYHIISLGCFKNQTDSETANSYMLSAGFSPADSVEDADIIIVNTCGFIEDAKKESISVILDATDVVDESGNSAQRKKLVVAGCLSQRYPEELRADMPEIDFLYGVIDEKFVSSMCDALSIDYKNNKAPQFHRVPLIESPYEYIKIAEGCSNNCSYCAIPLIRGPHKSYSPKEILKDVAEAIDRGASELILIAQDTTSYRYKDDNIISLIRMVATAAPECWVRLLYCHPDRVTDELIELFTTVPNLVPYIDIPFQHVSQDIVSDMNRSGSYNKYMKLIQKIRSANPRIAIRSTFMVGYPGETEKQFEELLSFAQEACIDRGGAFIYSPEDNTPAAEKDDVPFECKVERYNRLSAALEEGFLSAITRRLKERVPVLVEEQTGPDSWIGRSWYDAPEVDGVFFLTGTGNLLNSIVEATVTDVENFDLAGEL